MERRPFGRDWGLSLRMALALVLLGALYLPFFLWLVAMGYFIWGGMVAVLVALGALGLLACAPYLSELLALSLARADRDGGPETIRLQPTLERLCAMADVPVPRLAVMPTDVPNAFSAGRNARNAIIIVTRGLVDRLDEEELEAVLAHELAHIANRDAIVMTISAAPALLGRKLLWGFVSLPATSPSIPGKIGFAMLLLYLLPVVLVPG
jgi:heat shock protein HtpX